jgi:hypothetical protein
MPVTSSDFVYYGGFHIFSSAVFLTTSTGSGSLASTWLYYGGFHVFQNSTVAFVTTSSGAVVTTFRKMITHHYLTRLSDIRV